MSHLFPAFSSIWWYLINDKRSPINKRCLVKAKEIEGSALWELIYCHWSIKPFLCLSPMKIHEWVKLLNRVMLAFIMNLWIKIRTRIFVNDPENCNEFIVWETFDSKRTFDNTHDMLLEVLSVFTFFITNSCIVDTIVYQFEHYLTDTSSLIEKLLCKVLISNKTNKNKSN